MRNIVQRTNVLGPYHLIFQGESRKVLTFKPSAVLKDAINGVCATEL